VFIAINIVLGMFRAWLKNHHFQHQVMRQPIHGTPNYDLSRSAEARGVDMSIG
jgi:hypothetical protein